MIRMVNSGTEATMSAIRVARGYTGRNKILKFEGCYHGHSDSLLVKSGSGLLTQGVPTSPGLVPALVEQTLVCPYNDEEALAEMIRANQDEIACVIWNPSPEIWEFWRPMRAIWKRYASSARKTASF